MVPSVWDQGCWHIFTVTHMIISLFFSVAFFGFTAFWAHCQMLSCRDSWGRVRSKMGVNVVCKVHMPLWKPHLCSCSSHVDTLSAQWCLIFFLSMQFIFINEADPYSFVTMVWKDTMHSEAILILQLCSIKVYESQYCSLLCPFTTLQYALWLSCKWIILEHMKLSVTIQSNDWGWFLSMAQMLDNGGKSVHLYM